jgi:hypothetical protein
MKKCSVCSIEKPLTDFHFDRQGRYGVSGRCKLCKSELAARLYQENKEHIKQKQNAYRKSNPEKIKEKHKNYAEKLMGTKEGHIQMLFKTHRDRARRKGLPFNITREYLESIAPENCPILGVKLGWAERKGYAHKYNCPSLDRIIPELGYVKGNVMWLSFRANVMKNDASFSELHQFADWVKKTIPNPS